MNLPFFILKNLFCLFTFFYYDCIQTTAHNILLGRDLLECVDSPRVHQQLWPDEVLYEDNFDRVNQF